MKTYKKTIITDEPLLKITYDNDCPSPRSDDNLGYFITIERNYRSPDGNTSQIYNIVKETGEEADNQEEHIKLITERINAEKIEKVLRVFPITLYEHTGVSYFLGNRSGFDYSRCGFYIVTDKTAELLGTSQKDFEKVIRQELEMYNQWISGEVYRFILFNNEGEEVDSGGGFYDIEDIKSNLPEEWKDENLQDYLIN